MDPPGIPCRTTVSNARHLTPETGSRRIAGFRKEYSRSILSATQFCVSIDWDAMGDVLGEIART